MKIEYKNSVESASLRRKAEEKVLRLHFSKTGPLIEADMPKLLHEYEVHMIELEMQNEELRLAINKAAIAVALYDFAPAGYFALNRKGHISQLNLSGALLLGKDRSSIINKNFRQFITPDALSLFDEFFRKVLETDSKQFCEVSLKIKEHLTKYVCLEGFASENDENCLMTVVDITDRKEVEESLHEIEQRYQLLFDNSLDAILLTSPDGKIIDANLTACQIFGRTYDELKLAGRNGIIDISDSRFMSAFAERSATGKFSGELTFIRKDGTKFPGELSSKIFKDKHGMLMTSMNIRDISIRRNAEEALHESEKKYRQVVEKSPNGIAIFQEGKIVFVNPFALKMMGGTAMQDLIGKPIRSFVQPESYNDVLKKIELVENGFSIPPMEGSIIRIDGSVFIAEVIALTTTFNGKVAGHMIIRDITDRKYIEDRQKKANQLCSD